ncbi:hypothetical protein OG585_16985 [Streptomyces sp. NBC_01340]|jgi:hypothetical protein|uniref:hypothetical protein n=1 Tax=unclassified Streptomyces TaxID=2593676 RepID=UPI00224E0F96|nr:MULTISPECIES: hypothetical protein [unclassified Streptomyces]MCX4454366.1 hypothetical protein [Streptomyces sp. NBC_01719]MCX4493726.1 hypothetical protein [Streptomyces sp. NBC_01728]WSI38825.1 hypothetical protein OG585_16985 [Streptomyces sp. NBC_01340]
MKFYPYKRLNRPVGLRVTSVSLRLPDRTRDHLDTSAFSTPQRTVALGVAQHEDWLSARIGLSATLPPGATDPDAPWSDLRVLAVLTDGDTNVRTTVELRQDAPDSKEWSGTIEVRRDDHVGRADLAVYAVATVDGVQGRAITETDTDWTIDTAAEEPLGGLRLDVKQTSFTKSAREWLRPYADAPWVVDASGRLPLVMVNTDVEGFSDLLGGETGGMENKVHELLLSQMATDVWTAVFHSAVGDLEVEPDGSPVFPTDWRGEVLREMLPDVVPGLRAEDALRQVHRRRTGDAGWVELQTRVHYAAVRRAGARQSLANVLRALQQINREDRP